MKSAVIVCSSLCERRAQLLLLRMILKVKLKRYVMEQSYDQKWKIYIQEHVQPAQIQD